MVHMFNKSFMYVSLLTLFSAFLVGWPLGLNPAANNWKWMSDSVRDFALAVDESMKSED